MPTSAFMDKSKIPSDLDVSKVLGTKSKLWDAIKNYVNEHYGIATPEWKFYSAKWGWTMKLLLKKRNLFFFGPRNGFFKISFIFGDKAVAAIEKSDIPKEIIDEVVNAHKYMEGRGLQIEVKNKKDLETVLKLIDIKIND